SWVMRATATIIVSSDAPTPAMSSAMASGRVPCIHRKVTSTLPVFCSRKTMSTVSTAAARQAPNQAALTLVRAGERLDAVADSCGGAAVADSVWLRLKTDMTSSVGRTGVAGIAEVG